jgi:hypothetical protein
MHTKVNAVALARQSAPDDRSDLDRSVQADLAIWLSQLVQALRDTKWTADALDAHWGTSRGYAWRLVSGEKPWSVERMLSLPADVLERMDVIRTEARGYIAVQPGHGIDAWRNFVSGALGLHAQQVAMLCKANSTAPARAGLNTAEQV